MARKERRKHRLQRRLTSAVALRRVMAVIVPLMIVALSREFPKETVNDTCRFVVKAGVQTTTLTAARENAKQGKSRRQMWRTLQNLSKRKLQRAITNTIR